jgi:hypothetical protein
MSAFNSKDQSGRENKSPAKNPLSEVSKKGKTLGSQHASHGDNGVEKLAQKKGGTEKTQPKKS